MVIKLIVRGYDLYEGIIPGTLVLTDVSNRYVNMCLNKDVSNNEPISAGKIYQF